MIRESGAIAEEAVEFSDNVQRRRGLEGGEGGNGGEHGAAPGSGGVRNGLIGGVRFLVTSGVFDICPYVSFDMPRTGIELVKNN